MRIDNNAIKEVKVQKLQDFVNPNNKEDINLYCTVKIDNSFQFPENDCKVIVKLSNVLHDEELEFETGDLLIRKVKSRNKKRKILDSISFTKNYSSLGNSKTSILNFDIVIKKNDFSQNYQSKFFTKGLIDVDVFVTTKKKGIIFYLKKEIDIKTINVLNDEKINFVKNNKNKEEIRLLSDFIKSVRIFENNITDRAVSANSKSLSEIQSDLPLQDYKLLIYFKSKNKTGKKYFSNKSIKNGSIEFDLYELTTENLKTYSNKSQKITENKRFKTFVDILNSDSNFYTNIVLYNKTLRKNITNNNWTFEIKKENVYDWFLGLFYNIYLPKFFDFNLNTQNSTKNKNEIGITFDKTTKSKLNYEETILEKFSDKIDIKLSKISSDSKKLVKSDLVLKNLNNAIEEKELNLSKESISFKKFQSYSGRNTSVKLNNKNKNNFLEEFLRIEYSLSDDSKSLPRKVSNLKIVNNYNNISNLSFSNDKLVSSYYDLSYTINNIIRNNTTFSFNTSKNIQNAINLSFSLEDLNVKEYYTFLGYESFENFAKSLLVKIDCKIYENQKELFRYNNTAFLEKFYQDSASTKNLVEKDIKNYSLFTKNYSREISRSSNLNVEYCIKVSLVRKETYEKISLQTTDAVKSLLYKDSYNLIPSQSFTNLEKSVNIIHSNNTSIDKAKTTLFDILYSNDFDYIRKDSIQGV